MGYVAAANRIGLEQYDTAGIEFWEPHSWTTRRNFMQAYTTKEIRR
jgi:hypothetical protein